LSRSRALTVPTLGLALGLALVLYAGVTGAFADIEPATAVAVVVLGLLAAGGLALFVRSAAWPGAVAGVLALAALVLKFSSDTLSPVIAVFLTGLVLLGVGAVLLLRRRTTDRR
jgi:MYXO-CTERM domain-containing protein